MRKLYSVLAALLCFTAGGFTQNVNVNPGAGSYADLASAFAAINAGTHTGAITIDIINNTTEPAGGAILNASGAGAASYTSILVQPSGGRTISGAITAGLPMIDLNGADNVTINGLNTGGNVLVIANTTVSATTGTSTIRFIGGATNNTITNCFLQGSVSSSVATNGAIIFFSTDAVTGNGNDNNTISNNDIGPAGASFPSKAILGNGSTGTTAIGNSGIVITNNDIHDFFAVAVTSSGVATNGGCNAWSITNNRFFQTGTRTWTTGATHRAIDINNTTATSGAQGFTITGNIVGYASSTQTGTYTLTGSTGKFHGIVFNGITGGTVSNINNNTVAAVSMTGVTSSGTSTTNPFMGILLTNGQVISNNNTIGSQAATGSLTFSTTTTTATDVIGIYNFTVDNWTANGNNIGGISVTNAAASGTFVIYGVRINTGTALLANLTSNNVGGNVANSIQLTATGTSAQVIGIHTSNAGAVFTSNTVRNLACNVGTGTTTGASVIGINITTATPNHTVSQNTIYNLSNSNATAASVVTGLQITGATANLVQRNLIYDLSVATNSTAAEVNGIRIAAGTTTYRNNMIRIGAGIPNAIGTGSTTGGVNGITEAGGINNFYHNSIYIDGAPTAGVGPSYALNSSVTASTRAYRNNILFNARNNSGATGKNYIIRVGGTAANPAGLTINNNVYFATGAGNVFGFFNALDVANLAAWQVAVGQDAGSFQANPQFLNPAAATPDLHLNPSVTTVAEANGFDVGVTDDYDGQTRSTLTPVDIGADAGNYMGIDLSAPAITYTPLLNTSLTTNRTITATITDASGVATGATAPRIYYNKNGGAYVSTPGSLTSGTVTNGVWTFTIDNALLGGVVTTDVIRYFVVAQDVAGNVGANPGIGFAATDVNTVTTPPTTPNQYTITPAFSGPYDIGTGQTYTSLTNAGGIFEAINNGAVTGNVTLNIVSDLSGELGTNALNEWAEDGAGNYNMVIRPAGAARTVTGSNIGALIRINGADRVTIDGSTAGATAAACMVGGNAAIRELTIQNTNTGTSTVVVSIQSGTNGAKNITLKNVNVLGQDPTTTLAVIALGGNTPGTIGTDNDSCRIENCSVKRGIYGIYSAGNSAANPNIYTVITQNNLDSTSATDRVRRIGITIFNDTATQITYNSIVGINTNESSDAIGIGVGTQGIDNTVTTTGNVVGALVSHNRIIGVNSTSVTGFSAAGIAIAGGTTGGINTIANNMISGIMAPTTSPDILAGIFVAGPAGSNTRIYHNSVSLTGNRGAVATQMPSFGIAITGANPVVDLKNNIFFNIQEPGSGGTGAKNFAIGTTSTTFTNMSSNYNDFWTTGSNDGGFRSGSLGALAGTDYATVAAWSAAVGSDANSVELNPMFLDSVNNLHINPATCSFKGLGTPLAAVTNDYDCNGRSATAPDMGADEFNPVATPATLLAGSVSAGATVNQSVRYTVSGTTDFLYTCDRIINTINPSGASPVTGNITTGVRVDTGANKMGTGVLYAARFYAIEPVVNPATSSATITLYYLQSEFNNFNAKATDSAHYPLPTGPGDAVGISNLIIRQFHGTPTGGYRPGNYTGTNEDLDPADANIVWNATLNRWEVTVNVSSFSGFFLTSKVIVVPVRLLSIRGEVTGSTNTVYWTTSQEQNNRKFIIERSTDGRTFTPIGETASRALNGTSSTPLNYSFVDAAPVNGKTYYRLQMVSMNGGREQSPVVTMLRGKGSFEIVDVRPNPTTSNVYFNVIGSNSALTVVVRSVDGKEVMRSSLSQSNAFSINLGGVANGMYILEATDRNGEKATYKIIKQ